MLLKVTDINNDYFWDNQYTLVNRQQHKTLSPTKEKLCSWRLNTYNKLQNFTIKFLVLMPSNFFQQRLPDNKALNQGTEKHSFPVLTIIIYTMYNSRLLMSHNLDVTDITDSRLCGWNSIVWLALTDSETKATYWSVLPCRTVCDVVEGSFNFWVSLWMES